jgi:hypothetical protein
MKEMTQLEKMLEGLLKFGKRITCLKIYLMFLFAMMGGVLFFYGIILTGTSSTSVFNTMPDDVGYIVTGLFVFTLFFPFGLILSLFKICAKQNEQIEELKRRIDPSSQNRR